MVFKVCKGGVRSGNTLRGLHTIKARRYGRDACLIARTSLGKRAVSELVKSNVDDALLENTLRNTGVLLSLNKRQRWLVPATLRHIINSGNFQSRALVSMLEKHKLKRRANCVNFVCNKSRLQSVTPKQKRYFSLNTANFDKDVSNRERKSILRKEKPPKPSPESGPPARTVQVYTDSGLKSRGISLLSSKPEYRLEVFYPCPKTCSLTFNPKYTDVYLDTNEEGEQEVRSVVNASKSKGSRHRMKTVRKLREWAENIESDVEQDVAEMWEEEEYHDTKELKVTAGDKIIDQNDEEEDPSRGKADDPRNILAITIAQAEKAKELCTGQIRTRKSRKGRQRNLSSESDDDGSNNKKNRVVYEFRPQPKQKSRKAKAETEPKPDELQFARVVLPTHEVTKEVLEERFGKAYGEADCAPRRFVIDVTDDVKNILSASRSTIGKCPFTSFLVFIHDGCYDQGHEVFRVCFNSYLTKDSDTASKINASFPSTACSIDDVFNQLFGTLLDLKSEGILNLTALSRHSVTAGNHGIGIFPSKKEHASFEIFATEEEINRISLQEDLCEPGYAGLEDEAELFCDICYDVVKLNHSGNCSGTRLRKCGHVFCDDCWRTHIRTKLRNGAVRILCPGYECDAKVGEATLLTLVGATEVGQLLQRRREDEVETSTTSKWCPNTACGRVIRLDSQSRTTDVTCLCGERLCFLCLRPSHWPATCEQARDYTDRLARIRPSRDTDEDTAQTLHQAVEDQPDRMVVEGRHCPHCNRFIEKNGGCPYMVCRCGKSFRWNTVAHLSTKLIVRHVKTHYMEREDKKTTNQRQRTSMYQKAVKLRQEVSSASSSPSTTKMATKLIQTCNKDIAFKRELLSICQLEDVPLNDAEIATISTKSHVTRLLRSFQSMRQVLLHLTEFTFVLLQDLPASTEKSRILKMANDLAGYACFIQSVLDDRRHQDGRQVAQRLVNIREWAGRTVDTLLTTVTRLRV